LEQLSQGLDNTPHQTYLFNWREDDLRPKPFLKWAGGKSRLLPALHRCAPKKFGCYFEPFLWGGALFFGLCPQNAVLSDSNDELIHCYRIVRDRPEEVIERLSKLKVSEEEFYKIRAMRSEVLSAVARAARFIYLNKTCFNGLYRVNKNGLFNTPFGRNRIASLVDRANLRRASRALQEARLQCADYSAVLQCAVAGDFIYSDPPYLPISTYSHFSN